MRTSIRLSFYSIRFHENPLTLKVSFLKQGDEDDVSDEAADENAPQTDPTTEVKSPVPGSGVEAMSTPDTVDRPLGNKRLAFRNLRPMSLVSSRGQVTFFTSTPFRPRV
jgi:hypothetical protein